MKNYFWIISPLYFISIIFSLSSYSWMMMWMGMEMNLITFLFFMMKSLKFNSSESSIKYFLIQAVGSLMFLFSISTQKFVFSEHFLINAILPPMALMMKSGTAPFHSWTPEIALNLNLTSLFLFLTFQKIIPLMVMISNWNFWLTWILIINMLTGALGGIVQSSISKMLTYSSINNIGWILMSLLESLFMFYFYILVYFIMNYFLIKLMKTLKIKWISQINSQNWTKKISFTILLMSMSGLPPFLGFIPKWMILKKIYFCMPFNALLSVLISTITLFFYMKISIKMLLFSTFTKKWKIQSLNYSFFLLTLNFMSLPLFFILT